jgi:hypothetical protein
MQYQGVTFEVKYFSDTNIRLETVFLQEGKSLSKENH